MGELDWVLRKNDVQVLDQRVIKGGDRVTYVIKIPATHSKVLPEIRRVLRRVLNEKSYFVINRSNGTITLKVHLRGLPRKRRAF